MEIKSTKDISISTGVKILVYGQAGAGKTTMIKTLPNPIILSAEAGLLPLSGLNLPYIQVNTPQDMYEAYTFLRSRPEGIESVAIDSLSEIAEVWLNNIAKTGNNGQPLKDKRQAYAEMLSQMLDLVRAFRDLPLNVYMTATQERVQDEDTGYMLYAPSTPGAKLSQRLPYLFDEVFCLLTHKNEDGSVQRALLTSGDLKYTAKDRSGKLAAYEAPDLFAVISKIKGA